MKKWLKISLLLLLCFTLALFCACEKDAAPSGGGEEPGQTADTDTNAAVCTVTFDSDGGTPVDAVTVNAGEILKQPADPSREGFIFEGWCLPSGSLYKFRTPVTESMTLKASWIELGEAVTPEIDTQPATAYASEKVGGSFEVTVKQNRGYVYTYKWYLTNKAETSGGTLLEGQTEAGVAIPAGLKKGGRYYVYGEVTGTKSITGASASAKTGLTRVVIEERPLSVLFVGSGILARTVSRQEHDSAAFLQRIARADGEPLIVDSLVLGSNYSIWETGLVGTNYKNVTNMFESRKYDYVVLQLGRDNCLIRDETYNKERLAVTTIYDKVKKYNPCVKVVCVVPYTRQDVNSSYYKDIYWKHVPRVETPDALSELIDEFWNRLKDDLPMDYSVVNSNAAFQLAKKNGIQPYVDETNDFAGVQGSYLQACLMYAVIFNKSPVGIRCFETDKFTVDPEVGVKLQALAAQVAFGTKTTSLPDVSDYTRFVDIYEDFIEKDLSYKNDPIYKYPEPTVMTKLPAENEDSDKKQIRLFLFGSIPMSNFNAAQTLVDMIKEGEKADVVSSFVKLEHTSSTTYNLYEFFKERNDINDLTFSTLRAGPALKSAADKGLDYVILQTGKDYSLSSEEHYNADVISCCKIAKIASEKNPDVKIILVTPYPNTQSFTDVKVGLAENMRDHAALINKQAEDAKAAILKGNFAKNVQVVYVTDAFMNYGDDDAIVKDLYQKADGREGRYNGINRANAQGSYLMAATVYASVFKKSPVGMPVYGSTGLGYNGKIIDGAMLLKLQKQAYKTAFGKDYKGNDPEHTVTFFTNGGTPVAPLKAKTGAKIPAPKDPVREGLIFAGWFFDPELSGRFSFMQATMPPSDITLYAGWAKPAGSGRSYGAWHTDIKSVLFVGSGPVSGSGYDTGSFFKAIAAKSGRTVKVDTLAKGNNYNIWETGLVGENASEVEKLCKENKYDTLVLMLGRDNALLSESTAQKEIKMIHAIYDAASKHNPDVQVLFFSNYGRQDLEGNMYKQYFIPAKITGRADHAAAIEKYLDKVASVISFPFRIADVNRAFELCISRGVLSPYGSLKTDFADVYGSYLSAACVFAETFKESPVGLDAFTCEKGYEILPSYGMKLQAVAAEAALGIKTDKVREVDDATWVDPDTGKTSTAPPPTLTDGTKVKVHFDDETVEGAMNVFMFGGYSLGSFNMYQTLKNLMTAAENKPMNLISATFSHTDTSTTFNLYELFASSARGDINDETFSSLSSGKRAYRYFNSTRFDYLILQTGRDHSIISESTRRYNITTAAKLAKIAYEKNPNVKVILVGPYPHMANFGDFASMDKPITDYASHTAAINDELSAAKEAVQKITKNVVTVSLADLFLAYSSDTAKIKTDLYREANDVKTMANVGNRASAKGSYLAAAAVCAAALNKSPTGLGYFGYETSSVKGKLEKDDAIAMQKLASKFVLGKEGKVPDTFKVNIDPLNGSPITSTDAKEGDTVERPEDPVKEGYIFKGWYEGYDYSKEFNFEKGTVPFGGLTLVARWKLIVDRSTPPAIKEPNITTGDVGRSPTILIVGAGVFTRTDTSLPHDFTGFFEELLKKDGYDPEIRKRIQP
ncbi:MAG: InlB B-repeat-containing protein, partial [Clostridia bacterium]|nr:InlB B-repeat-containing protein [Clostridia bacterium]